MEALFPRDMQSFIRVGLEPLPQRLDRRSPTLTAFLFLPPELYRALDASCGCAATAGLFFVGESGRPGLPGIRTRQGCRSASEELGARNAHRRAEIMPIADMLLCCPLLSAVVRCCPLFVVRSPSFVSTRSVFRSTQTAAQRAGRGVAGWGTTIGVQLFSSSPVLCYVCCVVFLFVVNYGYSSQFFVC
ncbi:hypothetical protein B0I37DRAFT_162760 [Chaetomium sp. MPI-CAGE-AT-0009]|nr:hypothetical protein B0I37DRAFT_162760 [Chaetomium sp. MPI-CAGE-AT-0009]